MSEPRKKKSPRAKPAAGRTVALLREQLRGATASAIMAAAEEVFAEQGINRASVSEIAARAGIAVGTLYNHFRDRDALLAGILETRRVELLTALDAITAESFTDAMRDFIDRMVAHYHQHQRFFRILFQGELGQSGGGEQTVTAMPLLHAGAPEIMAALYQRAERLMRLGLRQRLLSPRPAPVYAALFMGLLRAVMMHDLLGLGREPGESIDASCVYDVFLNGAARN